MMGLCFIIIIHFEFLNDKNVTIQGSFSGAISRYSRIFLQEIASKFPE